MWRTNSHLVIILAVRALRRFRGDLRGSTARIDIAVSVTYYKNRRSLVIMIFLGNSVNGFLQVIMIQLLHSFDTLLAGQRRKILYRSAFECP